MTLKDQREFVSLKDQSGFTLLEIILSLAILATIGVITVNILSTQIQTRQKIVDIGAHNHTLDATLTHLTRDLEGASLPSQADKASLNLTARPVPPAFYSQNESLIFFIQSFHSYLRNSNQSNQAFVKYFVRTDPNNSNQKQLLRSVDTDMVDSLEKEDAGISQILIDDLDSFQLEYWDGNKYRKEWTSKANDTINSLPKLVKIHLSVFFPLSSQSNVTSEIKKEVQTLDTIVYLNGARGQKEVAAPLGQGYKWQ